MQDTAHKLTVWMKWTPLTLSFNLHFQVDPRHEALGKHSYSGRLATEVSLF